MSGSDLSPVEKMRLLHERFNLTIEEITYNEKRVPKAKWKDAINWMEEQWKADGTKT